MTLPDKIEQASEGSRELDALIYEALGNAVEHATVQWHSFEETPPFTTSIDAAMTLVPKGCLWTLDSLEGPRWTAGVWRPQKGWCVYPHDHRSATPALAIVAAALRAQERERDG